MLSEVYLYNEEMSFFKLVHKTKRKLKSRNPHTQAQTKDINLDLISGAEVLWWAGLLVCRPQKNIIKNLYMS